MDQQYRVVNLDKKQVLDPKLLGASRSWDSFAFTDSPVMGGLLWLLNGDWSGDRVAIVGNHAVETDLPEAEEVCGVPVSQLCFPTLHGHERFKNVSGKVREALTENYGYRFEVSSAAPDAGSARSTSLSVSLLAAGTEAMGNISPEEESFVVVNRDFGEFIHSNYFCNDPELRWSISNPRNESGEHSWLPTALAVLMSTSMEHQPEFFLDDFSGEWAGGRIGIESFRTANLIGLHDASADVFTALVTNDAIDDILAPSHEESEIEEDWTA